MEILTDRTIDNLFDELNHIDRKIYHYKEAIKKVEESMHQTLEIDIMLCNYKKDIIRQMIRTKNKDIF